MAKGSENGLLQGVLVAAPMLDYFTFYVRPLQFLLKTWSTSVVCHDPMNRGLTARD